MVGRYGCKSASGASSNRRPVWPSATTAENTEAMAIIEPIFEGDIMRVSSDVRVQFHPFSRRRGIEAVVHFVVCGVWRGGNKKTKIININTKNECR